MPHLVPEDAVMEHAVVPEAKRFCGSCNEKVNKEKGHCPKCGKPYSFQPTLRSGDILADQFVVVGPIAFGGLGWIYLAKDIALSRWVVLKGLLDAEDEASASVAVAERQFLAQVKHPNIVGVYTFVSRGREGFIVMEFVPGKTLRDIRKERGPLPPAEAMAYIHRVLSAFTYLHGQEPPLIYCDFKPENCLVDGEDVKLIDLGGVRRADEIEGDVYGTVGYSAPEAAEQPSPSSDLYTVARSLAVLILEFKGFQGVYKNSIPPQEEHPVLEKHESLYRFLVKATREKPEKRFKQAEEMAEQLEGVLHEVAAVEHGVVKSRESTIFDGDRLLFNAPEFTGKIGVDLDPLLAGPDPRWVPLPKLDAHDSAASALMSHLSISNPVRRLASMRLAYHRYSDSIQAPMFVALTMLEEPDASNELMRYLPGLAGTWQAQWVIGCFEMKQKNYKEAFRSFDEVFGEFPGEVAPQLAMTMCMELAGAVELATDDYLRLIKLDPQMPSALFGLARCYRAAGKSQEAVDVLSKVSAASLLHARAQLIRIQLLLEGGKEGDRFQGVVKAMELADSLKLEQEVMLRVSLGIRSLALDLILKGEAPPAGSHLNENVIRTELELVLRKLAASIKDLPEKVELIQKANRVRVVTWW